MQETTSSSVNNKRIAKNTMMLYIRMFLIMAVNLYTSRVILEALGVEDFGIYNIVGGVVVLFTFINNAMVSSTQRFLNYELGKGDNEKVRKVFSASLTIHICVAIVFFLLAETIGLWFLNYYINFPEARQFATNVVYQFSIFTSIINIVRAPYNAAIIAHEKMSFYAYISIVEVLLKLVIVYLVYIFEDHLIAYAILITFVAFIVNVGYYLYCSKKFTICEYRLEYNRELYCSIASFSGWSLFGSVANMGAIHGTNIMLNLFFGVVLNAAMGVATQVNSAIYTFAANFQTAFNPQIVKTYAAGNIEYFKHLVLNTSRYSFLLLFCLALPVFVCAPDLLRIWLGNVPIYAVEFSRYMLIYSLLDSMQIPLWVSAQASGNIKKYQLIMSSIILLNIPLIYVSLVIFHNPEVALIVRIIVNMILSFARVLYLRNLYGFPIKEFLLKVVFLAVILVSITGFPAFMLYNHLGGTWQGTFISIFFIILYEIVAIYFIGLEREEKLSLQKMIIKYIKNR